MFLLWLVFILLLVALPLGYGWSYRRWGPPPYPYHRSPYYRYPSYRATARRERGEAVAYEEARAREAAVGGDEDWGSLAVVVWIASVVGLIWLLFIIL